MDSFDYDSFGWDSNPTSSINSVHDQSRNKGNQQGEEGEVNINKELTSEHGLGSNMHNHTDNEIEQNPHVDDAQNSPFTLSFNNFQDLNTNHRKLSSDEDDINYIEHHHNHAHNSNEPFSTKNKTNLVANTLTEDNSDELKILVSSPRKEGEGTSDAHMTYLVTSKIGSNKTSIRRRFQDFDWLHIGLTHKLSCCLIPPLPERHRMEYVMGNRFGQEFVYRRQACLNRYLIRCASNSNLKKSEYLNEFLTSHTWGQSSIEGAPSGIIDTITDKFHQLLKTGISNPMSPSTSSTSVSFSPKPRPTSSSANINSKPDYQFLEIEAQVNKLLDNLTSLDQLHHKVLGSDFDLHIRYANLGGAVAELAILEKELNPILTRFSECCISYADIIKEHSKLEELKYLDPVKEYITYCQSIKDILKAREQKQIEFEQLSHHLQMEIAQRQKLKANQANNYSNDWGLSSVSSSASASALASGSTSGSKSGSVSKFIKNRLSKSYSSSSNDDPEQISAQQQKLIKCEERIKELEKDVTVSHDIQHDYSVNVNENYEIFQSNVKMYDFKSMMYDLTQNRIQFFEKSVDIWKSLLNELEHNETPVNS